MSKICPVEIAADMLNSARPDLEGSQLIQPEDVVRAMWYLATEPETWFTDIIVLRRAGILPFERQAN